MVETIEFTQQWDEYLALLPEGTQDIYFTEKYVRLYERNGDTAQCFVFKRGKDIFLMPFIKRHIPVYKDGVYFDFETPYGYAGPLSNSNDESFLAEAWDFFKAGARQEKIIAGFIRFHPLLNNQTMGGGRIVPILDRFTIGMDLTMPPAQIWEEQIHTKHRNAIRKAEKSNLEFAFDEKWQHYAEFMAIYRRTMHQRQATDFYFFDDDYFHHIRNLDQQAVLGIVRLGANVVAGAIFLRHGAWGHYHLAAGLEEYESINTNSFLIYHAALGLKQMGVKTLHLGGGTAPGEDNTLFKFKKRFSNQQYPFHVGRCIVDEGQYVDICAQWEQAHPKGKEAFKHFVLKYRY